MNDGESYLSYSDHRGHDYALNLGRLKSSTVILPTVILKSLNSLTVVRAEDSSRIGVIIFRMPHFMCFESFLSTVHISE